uniref:hypothetical protein n=1 Tax=Mariniflexile sp. TaxID=1979402 RepID=UPI0040487691
MSAFSSSFAQEVNISTEFSLDGIFYKTYDKSTHTYARKITEFKSGEACTVIDYLGKDVFKIKYNGWVGYVDSEYLVFTDEMSDLFYDFQEKERVKLIEQNEARQKRIQKIVDNGNEEVNEQKRKDSIAKAKEEERIKLETQQALAKRQEAERVEKEKQDAIAKAVEE